MAPNWSARLAGFFRKSKPVWSKLKPVWFVIATLLLWFFFQLLARAVITCVPGGDACLLRSQALLPVKNTVPVRWLIWILHRLGWPGWLVEGPFFERYLYGSRLMDSLISFALLALALWPTVMIFFPGQKRGASVAKW